MAIVNADKSNFADEIAKGVVLLDFYADWCGPCKMLSPVLEEVDKKLKGKIKIVKVNVDESSEIAADYNVMSIPTLFILVDGVKVRSLSGFRPTEILVELVSEYL